MIQKVKDWKFLDKLILMQCIDWRFASIANYNNNLVHWHTVIFILHSVCHKIKNSKHKLTFYLIRILYANYVQDNLLSILFTLVVCFTIIQYSDFNLYFHSSTFYDRAFDIFYMRYARIRNCYSVCIRRIAKRIAALRMRSTTPKEFGVRRYT